MKGGKVNLHNYKLRMFLSKYGFGQFSTMKERVATKSLFHNDAGILKVHDEITIKRWIREWLENQDDDVFKKDGLLDTTTVEFGSCDKYDILEAWQKLNGGNLKRQVLDDLPVYSEEGFTHSEKINLFSDTQNACHIRFKNGVVKVTKDKIELLDFSQLKTQGAVWESAIINKEIKITDGKGVFSKFAALSMLRKDRSLTNKDWRKEYKLDEFSLAQYKSMTTSYGFLIHTHNTQDVQKAIYFIDADSDLGKPQGGNGKSVVMGSLKHYKKTSVQDGKRFRQDMDGGGRFQFADVTIDTKFILIDDIRPEFSFEMLFSMITGDMEVEGKGTNKFTIPADRKPKFGLTTNYVIPGIGTSYKRRQHIVEFGNYWNRCNEEKESPSDKKHLGKLLFDDSFTSDDWNDFYSYGFNCVQEYLRDGLVASENNKYDLKATKATVEGLDGDGTFTDWLDEWIKDDRLKGDLHKDDGISIDTLYQTFINSNPLQHPDAEGIWDKRRFDQGVWDFIDAIEGYHYNKHLSKKGESKSSRRWQRGASGSQSNHIRITTDYDTEWLSPKVTQTNHDDDLDTMEYFKHMK